VVVVENSPKAAIKIIRELNRSTAKAGHSGNLSLCA
jgi:hypothetical protein